MGKRGKLFLAGSDVGLPVMLAELSSPWQHTWIQYITVVHVLLLAPLAAVVENYFRIDCVRFSVQK